MKLHSFCITGICLLAGTTLAQAQAITDFESYTSPSANGTVLFRAPSFSGSTGTKIQADPVSSSQVLSEGIPAGNAGPGTNALRSTWNFVDAGATPLWVRLTTDGVANLGRPTIPIEAGYALQFDVWSSHAGYVTANIRETESNAAFLADGGATGTIEFLGGNPSSATATIRGVPVAANAWTTLTFEFLNPTATPVFSFTGDGVLTAGTDGKATLESLGLAFDDNATIRAQDISMWFDNFAIVAVPEPTSAALVGGGLLALMLFRRRS